MVVWIDLTNSPHVLFFEPIINELKKKKYEIFLTARDYQQTTPLLEQKGLIFKLVGQHYGKSKSAKLFGLFHRSFLLWRNLRKKQVELSMSHGSPYCVLASRMLKTKNIWTLDGDEAKWVMRPALPFTDKIIVPEIVPKENIVRFGGKIEKIVQYPGLKEEVYLCDFKPKKAVLRQLGLCKKDKIIVMRPEASKAIYYDKKTYVLDKTIQFFIEQGNAQIVLIPRTEDQGNYYKKKYGGKIILPKVVDAPSLISYATLVVSGGGTMNREAVVLGTPVLSVYQDKLISIDKWLIANGYMHHSLDPTKEDIEKAMKLKKYKKSKKGREKFIQYILEELE